ncbi:MAG: nuclear transport factor 2 family protein [Mycobacteriaceae bacterium]
MSDPFAAFRAAIENHDTDAAVALFADDARFFSPVVHKPYVGREQLRSILTAVAEVFEDFRYTDTFPGDGGCVLGFAAMVGGRELQGIDMLRAVDGVLTELTVMVRPYSAATALRERMAALLPPA